MPAMKTHHIFGCEVMKREHPDWDTPFLRRHIASYNLGLQGPDLFFYNPTAYIFYPKNIGNVMHKEKVMTFFDALIGARNALVPEMDREIADAYICGFMGHYTLDCACHPYIYCRTQVWKHEGRDNYDFGMHNFLEADIDTACMEYYWRRGPLEYHMEDAFRMPARERRVIARVLHQAIAEAYPDNAMRLTDVYESTRTIGICAVLLRDPQGWKKKLVRLGEDKLAGYSVISGMLIQPHFTKYPDACNLEHRRWFNPWDPERTPRTDSFMDLMDQAGHKLNHRISMYLDVIRANRGTEQDHAARLLLEELGDCSYSSGYPIRY